MEQGGDVQVLLPPILNALQDSDSYVRSAALEALRTLVEKGADVQLLLPPILNAIKDSDSYVRKRCPGGPTDPRGEGRGCATSVTPYPQRYQG